MERSVFNIEREQYYGKEDGERFYEYLSREDRLIVRVAIGGILNYLETMALGIDRDLIDRGFVKDFFKDLYIDYYNDLRYYIKYRRENIDKSDEIWIRFTNLALEFYKEKGQETKI